MANIKGITIEIAGNTSKLTKALDESKKALVDTSRELKEVNKLLKIDPSNITLLSQKQELLSKAVDDTKSRLSQLYELQKKFGDSSKLTEEQKEKYRILEREIAQCENQLKGYEKQQEDVNNAIDNVNKGEPFDELSKDIDKTGKSALKTGDIIKANLISQAIISGVKSLARAFKTLTGTLDEWGQKAKDLEEQEAKVGRVMKNTTNATQEEIDAIIRLTSKQEKLGVVSQEAQLAGLQELGTYVEQKESLEKLLPVMNDMIAQQYGIGASMESAAGIATMLGKVLGNGQVDALSRLGYKFDDAQKKVLKYGTEEEKVAMLSKIIQQSVGGMNTALAQTDAGKLEIAKSYMEDFQKAAGNAFNSFKAKVVGSFLPQIKQMSNALIDLFDGRKSLTDIVNMIKEMLPEILSAIGDIFEKINNAIIDALPEILDVILQVVLRVAKELGKQLPKLLPKITEGILRMVEVIIDNIDLFIDAAIEIVLGLAEGLIQAIPKLVEKIPVIIEKLIDAIMKNIPKIIEAGIKLLGALAEGLLQALPSLVAKLPEIIKAIVDGIERGIPDMEEAGKNLMKGLWDGMYRTRTSFKVKLQNWAFGVIEDIKGFFGIHSPSKVMMEIGEYMGEGLALGIESTADMVQNAMSELTGGVDASVNPTINPTANTNPLYLSIDKFYNNRDTDIQQLAEELEFYRKNSALARGGM